VRTAGLGLLLAGLLLGVGAVEAAPSTQSASELIDAVNRLRADNGMDPLKVDPILMAVAQAQSSYNASNGELSHYGPSGKLTREDVMDAGYGGGATVFASENIAVGSSLTPGEAVEMWTGDEPHLNTMLGQYYRDVGAGVAESDGSVYYTLVTGYVAGGLSANSTVPAPGSGAAYAPRPQPVITATARPDGGITHVVQEGQTLWTIAAIYGIDLAQLLSLNGLTADSFVHPGDEITIRPAATPTATPAPPPTATPSPAPPAATPSAEEGAQTGPGILTRVASVNPRDLLSAACVAAWLIVVVAGVVIAVRRP
jgi:LysM repeat protein